MPRSITGVIDDAVRLYRQSFRRCAPIGVLGALISAAFNLLVVGLAHSEGLPMTGLESILQIYQEPRVMALGALESVLLLALFGALIVTQNAVARGDQRFSVGQALNLGFSRLGRSVGAAVVSTSLIVLGFLLIVPGIYLSGTLALWPLAVYLEDAGGLQSLDVSRRLIQGHWWHASGVLGLAVLVWLAFSIVAGVAVGIVDLPAGPAVLQQSLVQLVSAVANVCLLPMLPAALVALYNDLQLRRGARS